MENHNVLETLGEELHHELTRNILPYWIQLRDLK